jgi:hypothetical protein
MLRRKKMLNILFTDTWGIALQNSFRSIGLILWL